MRSTFVAASAGPSMMGAIQGVLQGATAGKLRKHLKPDVSLGEIINQAKSKCEE
jgi:hypothetical protein